MSGTGIGSLISTAVVAAIDTGEAFERGPPKHNVFVENLGSRRLPVPCHRVNREGTEFIDNPTAACST